MDDSNTGIFAKSSVDRAEGSFPFCELDAPPSLDWNSKEIASTDYVHSQAGLSVTVQREQLAYWTAALKGAPSSLELPTDKPRQARHASAKDQLHLKLSTALAKKLRRLAREQHVSLFSTLLSAWAVLLGRWSGQDEVLIGARKWRSNDSGRSINTIANSLPLRIALNKSTPVTRLLRDVETTICNAHAHADVSFEQVRATLEPVIGHSLAIQVLMELNDGPVVHQRLAECTQPSTAPFELVLSLNDLEGRLSGTFEYLCDLFDRETVQRMAACWEVLLKGMVKHVQRAIGELPLLTGSERALVVHRFNDSDARYPQERLIHELFEERARRTPHAVAVTSDGQSLTYAALDTRSNQLARHLRHLGIGPDLLVGICLERGLEMVVALLGVLKAGGAYVPIDPGYPLERIAYVLEDSAPAVLLTQRSLQELLPSTTVPVLLLDEQWEAITKTSEAGGTPLKSTAQPHHLAYVIYTSGSTGRPKGVMVEHRGVVNLLKAMQQITQIEETDRLLAVTTLSFDIAALEIYLPLISGAHVVVAPRQAAMDPIRLATLIEDGDVTLLQATPSTWRMLLDSGWAGAKGVKALCGGEALAWELSERLNERVLELWNVYGPTETTIWSTAHKIGRRKVDDRRRFTNESIGRPLANTQVYVLDEQLQPTPIGVAGELYIAGDGVARGYLNRPELTDERFLPNPFSWGKRMYRTGDRVRWHREGVLEFIGRVDHQVKIRGHRIEPAEIEAVLLEHPLVKQAVVVALEDGSGGLRLVAYVVVVADAGKLRPMAASIEPDLNSKDLLQNESTRHAVPHLREHLKSRLPEYMHPSAWMLLAELPLTPNGKVDRRALPVPHNRPEGMREYVAPRTKAERAIADVCAQVLAIDQVGMHDNFFELGGHSLLIVQMIARLRLVGFSAEARHVFESATVSDLATKLISNSDDGFDVPPNRIPPVCTAITPQMLTLVALEAEHIDRIAAAAPGGMANIQDIYPLAPLQQGILFHHLLNAARRDDTYVLTTLLTVPSRPVLDRTIQAIQSVIDRHDVLRTAIHWEGLPQPVQIVQRSAPLQVEEITLSSVRDPLEQLNELMARQSLDPRQAPLLRLQVAADTQTPQWYVLLRIHHLICDAESLDVFLREVTARLGDKVQAPHEAPPYRSHVAESLVRAKEGNAETFFRSKLCDIYEATAPFGLLDVRGDGSQIEEARRALEPILAKGVRAQARQLGLSAAALFHAAWGLVVSLTSGSQDEVVFGSVLSGRLHGVTGGERTLGMFINTLPLRLQLRAVTVKELVLQTQRELVELLDHEQASLAMAQRCSGITGSAPLFTSLLNYLHSTPDDAAEEARAALGIRMLHTRERTNYPVTLSVDDQGEGFALLGKTDRRIDANRVIDYMVAALQALVQSLALTPDALASSLLTIPPCERQIILDRYNSQPVDFPQTKLIHELFEEQVERTPDRLAVVHDNSSLTYAELNAKGNQLASFLRCTGVGPDQLVGLCVERGFEMVIGILGILKAGAAYVPLDPDYPTERLAYMVQDAAPKVVLTQRSVREKLRTTVTELIALDSDWPLINAQPSANVCSSSSGLGSHHLAYVIYTSGSTGTPKGVMVEHRNVVKLWQGLERLYEQSPECQRIAVNASFNFDASVKQFVQLLSGRTIVLVPQKIRSDARLLRRFITSNRVDGIDCTPSQLRSWIGAGLLDDKECQLRAVLVGGETIDPDLWGTLARSETIDFYNVYGPTECTVDATFARIGNDSAEPHIGRPMQNTRIYILNRYGQLAPIGVPGEIHIGGAGVARGYLNRPDFTGERFLPDSFATDAHARLYKTGDIGRWRPDGSIEYLGRNDDQVKIRGFRIELAEIEARLARHAHVQEAAVVVREEMPGCPSLVAYFTAVPSANVSLGEMRTHLKSALPEYMIPSAFVLLERFPLTPNGKLDRSALPAPETHDCVSRSYEAPQGEVEEILAGIWQDLLKLEQVGRNDNFFELGGHSLLIMQMVERLRCTGLSADVQRVFDSPTLADLAATLTSDLAGQVEIPANLIPVGCESITPQMLPLIDLDAEQIEKIVQCVPGGAQNIQDIYPLAPLQEGILFHHLLNEQGGDAYVLPCLLSVSSRQRLEGVITGLQTVIDRHDILRTAVLWENLPRPLQVVYRKASLPVVEIDLDPHRDPIEQLKQRLKPEHQELDLRRAPLMRLQIAADPCSPQWYVVVQLHHITSDHVTRDIVVSEVVAHLEGRAQSLPESVPYRNHVAQVLAYARTSDAEAFFREKFGEISEPTAPFGLWDVHGSGGRTKTASQSVAPELAQRARAQARRFGVSAATLFHSAWALVVSRTSGRSDVVYGSVLLGRLQGSAGAQRSLGMFINTLPLRLQLRGATAKELVERTQRELVELLNHEQASLAMAQRCSGITGTAPLFSSLFNYRHSAPNPDAQWSGATGVQVLIDDEWTNYPITVSVDDLGAGFTLTAQTDDRIDPYRITQHLNTALLSLVDALERSPHAAVANLTILPESERSLVIESFNKTQVLFPQHRLVHGLFEEQVERSPHALAVEHNGERLTYAELNRRANQLARYLVDQGVERDQVVGVCVQRSLEMVIALLGVLKAGGAYVPLDPNYPSERLQYMLEDAAPKVVLTDEHALRLLPAMDKQPVVLRAKLKEIENEADEDLLAPGRLPDLQQLVYVIYTSGSTGRPKGTAMSQGAMVNLIEWHRWILSASDSKRVLQFAALSFDVAFQETFSTLCTGGTLVLLDEWVRKDVQALMQCLRGRYIERLFVPPLMLQSLAEYAKATGSVPVSLQDVITAGEQLRISPEIVWLFNQMPACRLHNHYGPTETHVVTALTLGDDPGQWPTFPSLGKPISNSRIYVLDEHRQPVPIGVAGEIFIGGAGVAREYLRRPELTAERFLPDPFSVDPLARMYKTGDLGLWHPDGTIEYLGRNDQQVKLRGFRIELGEIEATLVLHESVREAAVIAREDNPGDKRLVAYVVLDPSSAGTGPNAERLRAHLSAAGLPEHMVPAAFVALDRLPLTPSGKLDRHALPAPQPGAYPRGSYEAPDGAIEEALAEIWQDLLHLQKVGRNDNFFELGGHSLLAMQVTVRIRASFLVQMPVRALFESPTLKKFSARLAEMSKATLVEEIGRGGDSITTLLDRVASMSAAKVKELIRELKMEGR